MEYPGISPIYPRYNPYPADLPDYQELHTAPPGRRRTESRRVEEPGRPEQRISHHHGSGFQKQSVYANRQNRTLPAALGDPYYPHIGLHGHPTYHSAAATAGVPYYLNDTPIDNLYESHEQHHPRHAPAPLPHGLPSNDRSEDYAQPQFERFRAGLSFGFSFGNLDSEDDSRVLTAQTSLTSPNRGGVKLSKNIVGNDSRVYSESIFNVSSSQYKSLLDIGQSSEAELIVQPPVGASERSLHPLLNWMWVLNLLCKPLSTNRAKPFRGQKPDL